MSSLIAARLESNNTFTLANGELALPSNHQIGGETIQQETAAMLAASGGNPVVMRVQVKELGEGKPAIVIAFYKVDPKEAKSLEATIQPRKKRHRGPEMDYSQNITGCSFKKGAVIISGSKGIIAEWSPETSNLTLEIFLSQFANDESYLSRQKFAGGTEKISDTVLTKVGQEAYSAFGRKAKFVLPNFKKADASPVKAGAPVAGPTSAKSPAAPVTAAMPQRAPSAPVVASGPIKAPAAPVTAEESGGRVPNLSTHESNELRGLLDIKASSKSLSNSQRKRVKALLKKAKTTEDKVLAMA